MVKVEKGNRINNNVNTRIGINETKHGGVRKECMNKNKYGHAITQGKWEARINQTCGGRGIIYRKRWKWAEV